MVNKRNDVIALVIVGNYSIRIIYVWTKPRNQIKFFASLAARRQIWVNERTPLVQLKTKLFRNGWFIRLEPCTRRNTHKLCWGTVNKELFELLGIHSSELENENRLEFRPRMAEYHHPLFPEVTPSWIFQKKKFGCISSYILLQLCTWGISSRSDLKRGSLKEKG